MECLSQIPKTPSPQREGCLALKNIFSRFVETGKFNKSNKHLLTNNRMIRYENDGEDTWDENMYQEKKN